MYLHIRRTKLLGRYGISHIIWHYASLSLGSTQGDFEVLYNELTSLYICAIYIEFARQIKGSHISSSASFVFVLVSLFVSSTQGDFEVLYNELDQWVHKETHRAKQNSALDEHERQAVYTEILDKVGSFGGRWEGGDGQGVAA